MKRINILTAIIAAVLFTACSKPTLEDRAKERSKSMLEAALKDSEVSSYELQNEKIDFSGDSLCILQFDVCAHSVYGETSTTPMEYVIGWTIASKERKPELQEAIYPISRKLKPVKLIAKDLLNGKLPDDKKECERVLRIYAAIQTSLRGRKVEDFTVIEPAK